MKYPVLRVLFAVLTGAAPCVASAASPDPVKTRQLIATAQSDTGLAERARALQQLALVATRDAVPGLTRLLADEKLGQYARDVLEAMPDAEAGDALRTALGQLQGKALVGVVNSLGLRRDVKAVDALVKLSGDTTSVAAAPALLALGRIATPEAVRAVESTFAQGAAELRATAAEAWLLVANRFFDEAKPAPALVIFEKVRRADVPAALRVAATRGAILADASGGLALLIGQLRSIDGEMRDVALMALRDIRGPNVTASLVAELDRLAPAMQAAVIVALVDRSETGVLSAVESRASKGDPEVRVTALRALGRIGRASSLPILVEAIRAPAGASLADVALGSLARISAAETNAFILKTLPSVAPPIRIRLIGVLGERRAEDAVSPLLQLAEDTDGETRQAAFRALGLVAGPGDLPRLISLALGARDDATKTLADRAVVTTSLKVLDPARRADVALQAFRDAKDPATRSALLRPLGAMVRSMGGSHEVFFAVRAALKDADEGVRQAALRCLSDWPDATPTTTLLEVLKQKDVSAAQRDVALSGAIRLARNVAAGRERSPLNVLDCFVQANRAVRTREEKLMIVSGLGNLKRPEAVAMLEPYLGDPEVQTEAALALVQIAPSQLAAKNPGQIKALLQKVAVTDKDEVVRAKAARLAKGGGEEGKAAKGKAGAAARSAPPAAGMLFNGKDLAGWDGDPGVWRVRDGVIVGGSLLGNPRNEFLALAKHYKNFMLKLEYKLVGTEGFVNGGVQFRSVRIAQPPNEMSGYQADIGAGHSGCLYDESRRKKFVARGTDDQIKRLEKPGDWNRYEIRCDGPRVEILLNGEKTVSYIEDDATVSLEGLIALQIHGNCKAEIAFRNFALKELP